MMDNSVIPPNIPMVPGTVARIFQDDPVSNPYLQIIYAKVLDKDTNGQPRWKIALSDSVHFIQAVALSPLNPVFESKEVGAGHVVRVTKYSMASLKGHYIMLVGELDSKNTFKLEGKLGEPTNVELSLTPGKATAPAPPAAAPTSVPVSTITYNGGVRPAGMATASMDQQPYAPPPSHVPQAAYAPSLGGKQGDNPAAMSSVPSVTDDDSNAFTPISALSPYQNTYQIKARVTSKSDVKTWAKEKSSGKLFSVNLIDASGEIKLTGFNDMCDKYLDVFQIGQVYTITGASVKMSNRRFSNVKNDYELHLENGTQVQHVANATGLPSERFDFRPICTLGDVAKDETVDVIGVAHDVGELGSITVKSTGKQLSKRDLTLVDKTGHGVRVTLWGREAEDFVDFKNRAVVAIKHARVSDYHGRTLSTLTSSTIQVNPDIREAHELRGWYDTTGYSQPPVMLSQAGLQTPGAAGTGRDERLPLSAIKDNNMGTGDKPDYISAVATITYIKSDGTLYYTACPTEGCSKKVMEEGPNMWRCERCQKVFDRCEYRYIMSCQASDDSAQIWINAFNETGTALLGIPAEELARLKMDDEEAYKKVFERAQLQPYLLRLRVKQEMYQGEAKIRTTLMTAQPLAFADESKRLIDKIDKLL